MSEKSALSNPDEYPVEKVLRNILGATFTLFELLMQHLSAEPFNLNCEWRYYRDGHAWLCKVQHNKKTVFWLSVFEGYFKVAFYFSAKLSEKIPELEISDALKSQFSSAEMIGKVRPLVVKMDHPDRLEDVLRIAGYKKKNL